MKRRTWILFASLILIVSCFVVFTVSKKDIDPSITIEQLSWDALTPETEKFGKELEDEGAQDIQYFEIGNVEGELLYVELSGRRVIPNEKESDFEVFLQYPQDKKSLVLKSYQDKVLLISYRNGNTLHEYMTNSASTAVSNASSADLDKEYCAFISAIGPVEKNGTRLGYAVFSDDKMIIASMKEEPSSIEKKISEDDFVYEYRITVEVIKAES
ncbi:hypothetical protein [Enterococcus larvae]|uniref:hypothetical protein n=1 Tax=Enterococcus larvae TaxID=2794352 RepID=UPI003F3CA28D